MDILVRFPVFGARLRGKLGRFLFRIEPFVEIS